MDEKIKQGIIVRQSQLKNALDYYRMLGVKPTLEDIVRVARTLTTFCMDGHTENTEMIIKMCDNELKKKFESYDE